MWQTGWQYLEKFFLGPSFSLGFLIAFGLYCVAILLYTISLFFEEKGGEFAEQEGWFRRNKAGLFILSQLYWVTSVVFCFLLINFSLQGGVQIACLWGFYGGIFGWLGFRLGKKYQKWHLRKADFYRDHSQLQKAVLQYKRVSESFFSPSSFREESLFYLAECYHKMKKTPEDLWAYRAYLAKFPQGVWASKVEEAIHRIQSPSTEKREKALLAVEGRQSLVQQMARAIKKNPPSTSLEENRQVGDYILIHKLGEGAFGQVWKAHHRVLTDKIVALKILLKVPSSLPEMVRRQNSLSSPCVVTMEDVHLEDDPPYLVMEYVDGLNLKKLLSQENRLPLSAALYVVQEVLTGLEAAHQKGLIHQDLKPENILISQSGEVKICDFELGKAQALSVSLALSKSGSSSIRGTLAYMAPEQVRGNEVDGRADLYSLGMILFEMLTGDLPQPSDRLSHFVNHLPKTLETLFAGSYTRLEKRFSSAGKMREELKKFFH